MRLFLETCNIGVEWLDGLKKDWPDLW